MGMVSSKRQVNEKDKGQWSPLKASAQDKAPPPLPPLVVFNHLTPPPPEEHLDEVTFRNLLIIHVHTAWEKAASASLGHTH
ncbi:hypothetical protein P7K49_027684 [Saguinus oedipus]|uniref:Uncharacterized protein n=1 Tax=Saguinus oedipus TaxID=9490 RepID=A0ABQ9UAC9_SAGOE|nr:hypothetical protein P7K49_027684 [Saguinus oedipus]